MIKKYVLVEIDINDIKEKKIKSHTLASKTETSIEIPTRTDEVLKVKLGIPKHEDNLNIAISNNFNAVNYIKNKYIDIICILNRKHKRSESEDVFLNRMTVSVSFYQNEYTDTYYESYRVKFRTHME